LLHHSHYDVIRGSRAYGTRSAHSLYDVILIVTSFTTELATPTVTDGLTYVRYIRTPYHV